MQITNFGLSFQCHTIFLKSVLYRIQQILIPKWFRQKFHGTGLQCLNRHRHIPVSRNKDDGNSHADLGKPSLEIESAHLRQPYIQDQATRLGGPLPVQKLLTSRKRLGPQANGFDEVLYCATHPTIVIDDENGSDCRSFHECASSPRGSVK
jgi:hypothetical protein